MLLKRKLRDNKIWIRINYWDIKTLTGPWKVIDNKFGSCVNYLSGREHAVYIRYNEGELFISDYKFKDLSNGVRIEDGERTYNINEFCRDLDDY